MADIIKLYLGQDERKIMEGVSREGWKSYKGEYLSCVL